MTSPLNFSSWRCCRPTSSANSLPTPQSPTWSIRQFCFVPPAAATAAARAAFFHDQASEFCCRGGFNALSLACYRFILFFWRHSFLKSKYSVTNSPLFALKISPNWDRKWFSFFGGWGRGRRKGVATFMSTGYTFIRSLEKSRQLSRNLPRDARHSLATSENWPPEKKRKKHCCLDVKTSSVI